MSSAVFECATVKLRRETGMVVCRGCSHPRLCVCGATKSISNARSGVSERIIATRRLVCDSVLSVCVYVLRW